MLLTETEFEDNKYSVGCKIISLLQENKVLYIYIIQYGTVGITTDTVHCIV